jgi:hypothetical protein
MLKLKTPMTVNHISVVTPGSKPLQHCTRTSSALAVATAVQASFEDLSNLMKPLQPDNVKAFPQVPIHEPVVDEPAVKPEPVEKNVVATESTPEAVKVEHQETAEVAAVELAAAVEPAVAVEAAVAAAEVADVPATEAVAEAAESVEQLATSEVNVTFLGDTTIPDGACLPAGTEFDKTWYCHFSGLDAPKRELFLRFQGGHDFGANGRNPTVVHNTHTDDVLRYITIEGLKVPESGTNFYGVWRFVDADGNGVGEKLWVE